MIATAWRGIHSCAWQVLGAQPKKRRPQGSSFSMKMGYSAFKAIKVSFFFMS
jgi:hypothetical protein